METCKSDDNQLSSIFPELYEQINSNNHQLATSIAILGHKLTELLGPIPEKEEDPKDQGEIPGNWTYGMDEALRSNRKLVNKLDELVHRL